MGIENDQNSSSSGVSAGSPNEVQAWVDYIASLLSTDPQSLQAILGVVLSIALMATILIPVIKLFNSFFDRQLKRDDTKFSPENDDTLNHQVLIEYKLKFDLLNEEKIRLRDKIDRCSVEYSKDLETYRRELRELKSTYTDLKGEFERVKAQLEMREAEVKRYEDDYRRLRRDCDKLQIELTRAETLLEMRRDI